MVNIDLAESGERDGERGSRKAGAGLANNWTFQLPVCLWELGKGVLDAVFPNWVLTKTTAAWTPAQP